jgi:hypothetical protein
MNHPDWLKLSGAALRLMLELAKQYNGHSNNGDLSAAWSQMRSRGFGSEATLSKAIHELLDLNFIVRTREGRFMNPGKQCALYAVTWANIDECVGKGLDISATRKPLRSFASGIIKTPSSETVASGYKNCSHKPKKPPESAVMATETGAI